MVVIIDEINDDRTSVCCIRKVSTLKIFSKKAKKKKKMVRCLAYNFMYVN